MFRTAETLSVASTWLLIPDGTDSVLLIFGTEKTENKFRSYAKMSEYTVYYILYKISYIVQMKSCTSGPLWYIYCGTSP